VNTRAERGDRRFERGRGRRAIVGHDHLEIGKRLCEDRSQRARNAGAGAKSWNDDRNSAPCGVGLGHMRLARHRV
jgi:hypothetical protein